MKKIVSILLLFVMLMSALPIAYAGPEPSCWECGTDHDRCVSCGQIGFCSVCNICNWCDYDPTAVPDEPVNPGSGNYGDGTLVIYDAEDPDGDGNKDNVEAWTVTVPAKLAPGETGYVVAQGTWSSARKLVVALKENTVTLTNSINAADTKILNLTFTNIELVGNNLGPVSNIVADTAPNGTAISVAEMPADALFGTWSGLFEYEVGMVDVA